MHLEFNISEPGKILEHLARQFDTEITGNTIQIPNHLGTGYIMHKMIEDGLSLTMMYFKLHEAVMLTKTASNQNYFPIMIWCPDTTMHQMIDAKWESLGSSSLHGTFYSSPSIHSKFKGEKESQFSNVTLSVTKKWIEDNLIIGKQPARFIDLAKGPRPFCVYESVSYDMVLCVEKIAQNLFSQSSTARLNIKSKTIELLGIFIEKLQRRGSLPVSKNLNSVEVEKVLQLKNKLENNPVDLSNIEILAKELGMSVSKLQKYFKHVIGVSIYQYALKIRMQMARNLLATRKYSVSEVGFKVGYSNLSHFTAVFKRQFGINPKSYLQNQ